MLSETVDALIWARRGAGLSRGRQDVDKERVKARWNGREERHTGFLFGKVLERGVTSLFLDSERERENKKM